MIIGDSHPAWSDVGGRVQRRPLHYLRDMCLTLKKSKSSEFKPFSARPHRMLKSSTRTRTSRGGRGGAAAHGRQPAKKDRQAGRGIVRGQGLQAVRKAPGARARPVLHASHARRRAAPRQRGRAGAARVCADARPATGAARGSGCGPPKQRPRYTLRASCAAQTRTFMADYLNGRQKSIPMPERGRACAAVAARSCKDAAPHAPAPGTENHGRSNAKTRNRPPDNKCRGG